MTIELPVSDEMKRRAADRERIKRSALPAIDEADEATDTANEATSIANPEPPAEPEQVAAIAPATTAGRRSTAHPRAAARTPASDPESVLHANFEAEDWLAAACLQRPDALARDSICVVACPSGRPMVTNRGQDRDPLTSRCPIRSR